MARPLLGTSHNSLLTHLRYPWPLWLLVLSGLLLFSPLIEGGTTHVAVMFIRFMVLLLVMIYLSQGLQAGRLTCARLYIGLPVMGYLGVAAGSTAYSPYTHQSLQWLAVLLTYACLLYLLVSLIEEWDDIGKLLAVFVGIGVFEAGSALYQQSWLSASRPSGTFFNSNFLAGYLAAAWAVALGFLCYTPAVWKRRRGPSSEGWSHLIQQTALVALLSTLLLAIVCTGSRGGVVALLAGTALVIGVRFGWRGLAFLLLLSLTLLLVSNPLRERVQAEHAVNPVGYARWQIWQGSTQAMVEHPLGAGLGLYQYVTPQYAFPVEGQVARYGKVARTAHNEYLQMGVELGAISIPIFCWGILGIAREARFVQGRRLRRWQRGVLVGVTGAIAAILVHACVDSILHAPAVAIALTLCVGIILSARKLVERQPHPAQGIPLQSLGSKIGLAGVGILTVAMLTVGVARLGLAWTAFEAGTRAAASKNYDKAIMNYQTAIALDPKKALYHSSLAATYFGAFERTGDRTLGRASLAALETSIELNPLDGRRIGLLGHVYASLAASATVADSPGNDTDQVRTAWLESAQLAYERAAELEPFNPFHLLGLGRLYLLDGEPRKAEAAVRRAVDMEPNFLPGRAWLARYYLDSGQIEGATGEYQEIVRRQQQYAAWPKGPMENRFLTTDVSVLRAALEQVGPHT